MVHPINAHITAKDPTDWVDANDVQVESFGSITFACSAFAGSCSLPAAMSMPDWNVLDVMRSGWGRLWPVIDQSPITNVGEVAGLDVRSLNVLASGPTFSDLAHSEQ